MTSTTLARNRFVVVTGTPPPTATAPPSRRVVRVAANYRTPGAAEPPAHDDRHALAVFCFERPDGFVGGHVRRSCRRRWRGAARRSTSSPATPSRRSDDVTVHAVGECNGAGLLEQVQEFTHRATNAFLHAFPTGGPPVTLMGFEWSADPGAVAAARHPGAAGSRVVSFPGGPAQRPEQRDRHANRGDRAAGLARVAHRLVPRPGHGRDRPVLSVPEVADRVVGRPAAVPRRAV